MAKIRFYDVEKKERYRVIEELYEVIGELKSKDEVVRFLFGLFTPSEVLMVSRRIQVAKMLIKGLTYIEISKEIGVSDQTIRKVEHWLKSDESRMKFISSKISKIKNKRGANVRNYESLLDRYPEHRFMKELFGL
jgi:TrpR family trp operon transcriptional repressor